MTGKPVAEMTRGELVQVLIRFNPWGGYCVKECKHPGHSTNAYRKTVAKVKGEAE
jgi:hypothetical protein